MRTRHAILMSVILAGCGLDGLEEPELGTAWIDFGAGPEEVAYVVENGEAIMEGDIILGEADRLPELRRFSNAPKSGPVAAGAFTHSAWPHGIIRYRIDDAIEDVPGHSDMRDDIERAIDDWNDTSFIQLIPDDGEGAGGHHVYITGNFAAEVGASALGYSPPWLIPSTLDWQEIRLGAGVNRGTIRHEIGHTIGLLHEQNRNDRDENVTVFLNNVPWYLAPNYWVHGTDASDYLDYNIDSLMHYTSYDAQADDNFPTMVRAGCPYQPLQVIDPDCIIEGTNHIQDSDRHTVLRMYAGASTRLENAGHCLSTEYFYAGAPVSVARCREHDDYQQWYRLYRARTDGGPLGSAHQIVHRRSLLCLAKTDGSKVLELRACNGSAAQLFEVPPASAGGIVLRHQDSERCVEKTISRLGHGGYGASLGECRTISASNRWFPE